MAESSAALHAGAPLTQRLAETPPWSPLRLALAMSGTLYVLFFASETIFDRLPLVFGNGTSAWDVDAQVNFRITVVMVLILAYLPAAYAVGVRGARRAVEELSPFLRPGDEASQLASSAGRFDPASLRRAGLIGVACSLLIPFWIDRTLGAWAIWSLPPEPIFQRFLLPAVGWFAGRFIYSVAAESRRLSAIGRDHLRIDLLDLRCSHPSRARGSAMRCSSSA